MTTRTLRPIWLLGLCNLPFSISSTILLITVPQLLAARGVPEPTIASITAFALIPGFAAFLVSPILDVRVSRRTWAIALALVCAGLTVAALADLDALGRLRWLLFLANAAATLFQGAIYGWMTGLVEREDESRLGAWITIANIGGFGVDAVLNITLFRALPAPLGALALAALVVVPLLLLIGLPAPPPDRRLARESFGDFFRDLGAMAARPSTVRTLMIFALPAACFSLTNMLGGLGRDYGASERLVGIVAGLGVTIAGVIGGLGVVPLARRLDPLRLYAAIGAAGALFTLVLIGLPRTPVGFTIAMVGENIAQAAAFATGATIVFREVGKDNPLAATQCTVLTSAILLPLAYMQALDGQAYGAGGLRGAFLADAGMGLAGSLAIVALITWWRVPRLEPVAA